MPPDADEFRPERRKRVIRKGIYKTSTRARAAGTANRPPERTTRPSVSPSTPSSPSVATALDVFLWRVAGIPPDMAQDRAFVAGPIMH